MKNIFGNFSRNESTRNMNLLESLEKMRQRFFYETLWQILWKRKLLLSGNLTGHHLAFFIRRIIQAWNLLVAAKVGAQRFQVLSRREAATFRVPGHFRSRRGVFCRYYLEDACSHRVRLMPLRSFCFLIENQNLKEVCERTALTVRGKRSIWSLIWSEGLREFSILLF